MSQPLTCDRSKVRSKHHVTEVNLTDMLNIYNMSIVITVVIILERQYGKHNFEKQVKGKNAGDIP